MSELTQCNYCSLQRIKAQAKHDKKIVTMMPGPRLAPKAAGGIRGIDVYVHPRSVNVREIKSREARDDYWVSWFWELTDHCVC